MRLWLWQSNIYKTKELRYLLISFVLSRQNSTKSNMQIRRGGEWVSRIHISCQEFEQGVEPNHIVDTIHYVLDGFECLVRHNPFWYQTFKTGSISAGKHPIDVFLGSALRDGFKLPLEEYKYGFKPIRLGNKTYEVYLAEVWEAVIAFHLLCAQRTPVHQCIQAVVA